MREKRRYRFSNIKKRRTYLKMTQSKLAQLVGVSQTSIYHIERGAQVPRANTLAGLANALECNVNYFFEA